MVFQLVRRSSQKSEAPARLRSSPSSLPLRVGHLDVRVSCIGARKRLPVRANQPPQFTSL